MEDEGRDVVRCGLGLCCVCGTDEVWIVRQSSALERKRGFVLRCVRIFAVREGWMFGGEFKGVGFLNSWL